MASFDIVVFEVPVPVTVKHAQTYDLGQRDDVVRILADGRLMRYVDWQEEPVDFPYTGTVLIDIEDEKGDWYDGVAYFVLGLLQAPITVTPSKPWEPRDPD